MSMQNIDNNIKTISASFTNTKDFEPFIRSIKFTNFKNIMKMQELLFDFPITALVGKNGTNKTSVLVALYGSVSGKSPLDFWFTTPIDKANGEEYQSYFYTYLVENNSTAEVLMINNQRKDRNDPDRWETDKPRKKFNMNTNIDNISSNFKTSSRWNKIRKNVLYINFRSEISAFDRCFYHANKPSLNFNTKQDYIREKTKNLKNVIDKGLKDFTLYNKKKVFLHEKLSNEEIATISYILDKNYSSISYIEHSFFDVTGGTAILSTDKLKYSEAYAGSGEFAIVSLVHKILKASDHTLILLDEPEVSLHPNAQRKLVHFLCEVVKRKKHQVVFSTHSPEIISLLPKESIKLFSTHNDQVEIENNIDSKNVFIEIGHPIQKIHIYVEDKLSVSLLNYIISRDEQLKGVYEVISLPGGADSIMKRFLVLSEIDNHQYFILFDGDQKTDFYKENGEFPNPDNISDSLLDENIKNITKCRIEFNYSGGSNGGNINEKVCSQRKFIKKAREHIAYFPFDIPEVFILQQNDINDYLDTKSSKAYFERITQEKGFGCNSDRILHTQEEFILKMKSSQEIDNINRLLHHFKDHNSLLGFKYEED